MALKIYNTLSRELELFEPIEHPRVGLYTCGPTVYNHLHIGNWRAYIFSDLLKRYLKYGNYDVKHVMNITDVEDKIIREVVSQNKSLTELTEFYTKEFFKDRDLLNILPADTYTKATDYIEKMVVLIQKLIDKDYAYRTDDGSVYFDIKKNKDYGKLSHFKLSDLKQNADGRLKKDEYEKENAEDFALWKAWTQDDGEVYWETSLGKGRPGWHIECSAMSMDTLGESFDLHTGGVDNIFPHHENEIAQSECATGKTFAKYFMHNEHLMVDKEKMAKSKGNFHTLEDLIQKGIDPLAFRLWLYTAHYRTKTNFTLETIEGSQVALNRIRESYLKLGEEIGSVNMIYKNKFIEFMDNDLDTPRALTVFWDLIKDKNIDNKDKKATMLDMDKIFGLGFENLKNKEEEIPEKILKLVEERKQARKDKDWNRSDELRNQIEELGYEIKDSVGEYKINKTQN